MERSDDSWIKWRNRQKHYKLLALFLFLLSVVSVCCLELIYKSLGVFFFCFFFLYAAVKWWSRFSSAWKTVRSRWWNNKWAWGGFRGRRSLSALWFERETQFVHYKHSAAQIASQAFECVLEVNAGLAETNLKSNQVLIRNRKNWCKSRKADNVPVQALKHTHTSLLYKKLKVEDTCFSAGDE